VLARAAHRDAVYCHRLNRPRRARRAAAATAETTIVNDPRSGLQTCPAGGTKKARTVSGRAERLSRPAVRGNKDLS
jgi:hypothetical protein